MDKKMIRVSCIVSNHCINGITLRLSGLKTMGINHTIIYDWEVEVIGNIYENPELLKTGASKNG